VFALIPIEASIHLFNFRVAKQGNCATHYKDFLQNDGTNL